MNGTCLQMFTFYSGFVYFTSDTGDYTLIMVSDTMNMAASGSFRQITPGSRKKQNKTPSY